MNIAHRRCIDEPVHICSLVAHSSVCLRNECRCEQIGEDTSLCVVLLSGTPAHVCLLPGCVSATKDSFESGGRGHTYMCSLPVPVHRTCRQIDLLCLCARTVRAHKRNLRYVQRCRTVCHTRKHWLQGQMEAKTAFSVSLDVPANTGKTASVIYTGGLANTLELQYRHMRVQSP